MRKSVDDYLTFLFYLNFCFNILIENAKLINTTPSVTKNIKLAFLFCDF